MLELKRSENTTQTAENGAKLRAFDNLLYQFQYAFSNGIENFLKLIEQFNSDYPGVFLVMEILLYRSAIYLSML